MTIAPDGGWGDETTAAGPPPPPPPVPPDPELGNRIGLGMLLAIAALVAIAAVLAAVLLTRRHHHAATPTTVTVVQTSSSPTTTQQAALKLPVPDLVGRPSKVAVAGLRNAGFHVNLVTVPSASPRGTVVAQSPGRGARALHGSHVRLNISNGAKSAASPHTTTTAAATTTTAPQTTTAQATTAHSPNTVASVPALSGELQPAVQRLDQAGFVASVAYVPGEQPLGTVIAQSPDGGSPAPADSQVTVNVSSGPNGNASETVPNVVGRRIPQAVSALQDTGLRLIFLRRTVTDRSKSGVIVAQTPLPGKHAPKNAQVLVYMGAVRH